MQKAAPRTLRESALMPEPGLGAPGRPRTGGSHLRLLLKGRGQRQREPEPVGRDKVAGDGIAPWISRAGCLLGEREHCCPRNTGGPAGDGFVWDRQEGRGSRMCRNPEKPRPVATLSGLQTSHAYILRVRDTPQMQSGCLMQGGGGSFSPEDKGKVTDCWVGS